MAPLDSIARGDVIRTIAEYNRLGRDTFLTTHGFENAHAYVLMHEGFGYDSHAVVGVAHRYSTVKQDEPTEFCGGEDGAAQVLRDLGFVVRGGEIGEQPAYTNAADVGIDAAQQAWLQAGRQVLIETAKSYHAVVTTKELGSMVSSRTRIRTTQQNHHWVADIVRLVARDCARRGEPLLASLTVNANGIVGSWYADVVRELRGEVPKDPDEHAARERLACYLHFGANVPDDGGTALLTPQLQARRERQTSAARATTRPAALCPVHHVELPATGVCWDCE
jgi:hypothetical protein